MGPGPHSPEGFLHSMWNSSFMLYTNKPLINEDEMGINDIHLITLCE